MEMIVHLHSDVYEIVKAGTKNIEVRINDEKRRKLQVGDTLIFLKRPDEIESIKARVIGLEYYKNFEELVEHYDMEQLYLKSYTKNHFLKELSRFYSKEEQDEYGVVAILFEKID